MTAWSDAVNPLSPVAWYRMDEASGTTLVDAVAAANGVTASSNITHNQTGLIPGDPGGKSKISASGAQIDTGTVVRDGAGGFTIAFTFKGTNANITGNGELFRTLAGSGQPITVGVTPTTGSGVIELRVWGGYTTPPVSLGSSATLLDGSPHLVVFAFVDGTQKCYIDGVLNGTANISSTTSTGSGSLRWCRFNSSNYTSGAFDDMVMFNAVLTASQVTDLYNGWLGAPPSPGTPTGLSTDPGVTNIELSWLAASGSPTGYDVRIDGGAPIDVGLVLSHDFTGLTPGTVYTLEVRSYNAGGDSAWASIGESTDPLPAPTGLDIISADEDSIVLGWDTHAYAEGFEVRIDGGTPTDVGLTTLHIFDDLDPLTMYELEVRAYLDGVFSSWSSIDGDTTPEAPPTGVYNVALKVGSHEWNISYDDVLDPEDPIQVLDGLKIGWEIPEADPWPTQPTPVEAEVGFYTADVANLADVAIGTPMSAVLSDDVGNVFATFHGRVTQEAATPIKRKAGLRMLYTLNGADYTVDLDEESVTISTAWPAESADARFARIVDLAATVGITLVPPADTGSAAFEELSEGTTTIGALIRDHLAQIAIESDYGPVRYIVAPVMSSDLVLDRFECVLIERTIDAANLPGTFAIIGGLFTLVFPDTHADGIVEAGDVRLDTTWNRLKYRAVNRVTVAGQTVTAEATRPGPPVRLNLSTTLTNQPAADRMADLYLPEVDEALGWVADAFQFLAHRAQDALLPPWFPDHRDDPAEASVYVMPIAIIGIPPAMNLAGDLGVYSGQLATVALRIERRKILVDFAQRRQSPIGIGDEAASWDWAQANFPAVVWKSLLVNCIDPDLSWYEARLGKAI